MSSTLSLFCLLFGLLVTTGAFTAPSKGVEVSMRNSRVLAATVTTLESVPDGIHRIVMMRHGESEFNNANIFTGWCDVALTPRGRVESSEAGQVFASHQLTFRKCYTSMLTRSIVTAQRALEAAGVSYTPMDYDWRLNERHYGALQGLSKERTAERLGRSRVMKWRRSYSARPPLMTQDHPHHDIINRDHRYRNLREIPLGESLEDCQHRVLNAWEGIVADIQETTQDESPYSLLVAHANTLRALVMYIDGIPSDEIEDVNIPTAIPFYYDLDLDTGRIVSPTNDEIKFNGVYIADERKKRSFLERRRTANDPWLWALHDHQVARNLLVDDDGGDDEEENSRNIENDIESLHGIEEEAARNTALFTKALVDSSDQA